MQCTVQATKMVVGMNARRQHIPAIHTSLAKSSQSKPHRPSQAPVNANPSPITTEKDHGTPVYSISVDSTDSRYNPCFQYSGGTTGSSTPGHEGRTSGEDTSPDPDSPLEISDQSKYLFPGLKEVSPEDSDYTREGSLDLSSLFDGKSNDEYSIGSETDSQCSSCTGSLLGVDFDLPISSLIRARARQVVDRVMSGIHFLFDLKSGIITCTTGGSSNGSSSGCRNNVSQSSSSNQSSNDGSKRKRLGQNSDSPEDDQYGDSIDRSNPNKRGRYDERRLACPFYKHTPWRCTEHRCCARRGWATIHRLKSSNRCSLNDKQSIFGVDEVKYNKLKSKKRDESTAAEKWKKIFIILFPDASESDIPCPYFSASDGDTGNNDNPAERLMGHLSRELPRHVRKHLENMVQEQLKAAVAVKSSEIMFSDSEMENIIRQSLHEVISGFDVAEEHVSYINTPETPTASEVPPDLPLAERLKLPEELLQQPAEPPDSSVSGRDDQGSFDLVPTPMLDFEGFDLSVLQIDPMLWSRNNSGMETLNTLEFSTGLDTMWSDLSLTPQATVMGFSETWFPQPPGDQLVTGSSVQPDIQQNTQQMPHYSTVEVVDPLRCNQLQRNRFYRNEKPNANQVHRLSSEGLNSSPYNARTVAEVAETLREEVEGFDWLDA
ncbi:hypothetical protein K469DRAFT_780693 [Zopfia rhizophila CBS 207.26]|uniref:Uncharacterized protein n=1 Tax=Zopfia rhizophila CBS 207.26 TaxID=1314779 RepID=A0A6A6E4X9_9PEZI|nr:hypothetical protein K469DRAFT_780693 [Zopfia rhizophila CBS 207.26]